MEQRPKLHRLTPAWTPSRIAWAAVQAIFVGTIWYWTISDPPDGNGSIIMIFGALVLAGAITGGVTAGIDSLKRRFASSSVSRDGADTAKQIIGSNVHPHVVLQRFRKIARCHR
jgi:hypothetical protein